MKRSSPFMLLLGLVIVLAPARATEPAANAPFIHPGGLHTQADFDRMRSKVAAGEHPWIDGWNLLLQDRRAQSDYRPGPQPHMASRQRAQDDASAAYLNALRWQISGDKANADCAARILNRWAATVNVVPYGPDQPGLSGIPIGSFALAAEVLRAYPGWAAGDQDRFKQMLLKYFYPSCHDFLVRHNGRSDSTFWANWDTCNMRAVMAIGVYCDDRAKFDEAVDYYKNGRGTGSIGHAVPYLYPGGLGQWQESGRDQAHVMGGMGLLTEMCQVAWNQGVDLFGYDHNRLLAGGEYTAQYNLGKGVPYTFYTNSDQANQPYISQNYHGRLAASHFELLYNHYVVLQGLKAPFVQHFAELRRPEPGEIDVFGFGTLTYTLEAKASPILSVAPPTPREVTATAGVGRVELKWSPSGAYTAHGYEIARATTKDGPYTSIYSTNNWTTPAYTDASVQPGQTYYYTVAALNKAGKSAASEPVSAQPTEAGPLPPAFGDDARAGYSAAAGGTFFVPGGGGGLQGNVVGLHVDGDFNLTARLIGRQGRITMLGLTARETDTATPRALAMTLGELGGRQARFHFDDRSGQPGMIPGDDYTWLPVWFRLQRIGDVFTAYQSSDGIAWFEVGHHTVKLASTLEAGLLVSVDPTPPKGKQSDTPQGTFDHFTIEQKPPAPPATPTDLKATTLDGGTVRLDWKNDDHSTRAGIKVEASLDGGPFYEIANLAADATHFENTGLQLPAALHYRLRAYNRGGYSKDSDVVP
ncbi:MAG: alginate lyase family protein [Chthoniobacteraceae bacterium]